MKSPELTSELTPEMLEAGVKAACDKLVELTGDANCNYCCVQEQEKIGIRGLVVAIYEAIVTRKP